MSKSEQGGSSTNGEGADDSVPRRGKAGDLLNWTKGSKIKATAGIAGLAVALAGGGAATAHGIKEMIRNRSYDMAGFNAQNTLKEQVDGTCVVGAGVNLRRSPQDLSPNNIQGTVGKRFGWIPDNGEAVLILKKPFQTEGGKYMLIPPEKAGERGSWINAGALKTMGLLACTSYDTKPVNGPVSFGKRVSVEKDQTFIDELTKVSNELNGRPKVASSTNLTIPNLP
jgi:hypothetical protein